MIKGPFESLQFNPFVSFVRTSCVSFVCRYRFSKTNEHMLLIQGSRSSLIAMHGISECSREIVFSTSLFEQVQLLKRLKSVNSENQVLVFIHAEILHVFFQLDVVENQRSDVVCVLLSQSIIWCLVNSSDQLRGVVLNSICDFGANGLGSVVSLVL